MYHRKLRQQWFLIPGLIMLVFSGSVLFTRSNRAEVYYVKTTTRTTEAPGSGFPLRHVTKSMAELGKMDEVNKFVLFLNHIPNCGAEVLIFLLQKLQGFNSYRHVRLKGGEGVLDRIEQEELVDKVYEIMRKQAVPLSFDGQLHFINFTQFDKQSPTFINMIREPADKAMSRSLYNKHEYKNDLIGCLSQGEANCSRVKADSHHLTIPYFCGHEQECLNNDGWALEKAKRNVEKYYPVVGVLEELNATLDVLEHQIPYFFKSVHNTYRKKIIDRFNRKKSSQPPEKIRKKLRAILGHEYDFYEWIKRRLFNQLQMFSDHK